MIAVRMWTITELLFFASFACAQGTPGTIVIGGDVSERTDPTVCERKDFPSDGFGAWFGQLMHSLCKRNDADSLTAAYLLSIPSYGGHGEPDDRLLQKALSRGKPSTKLLWAIVATSQCASPIGGCKAADRATKAGEELTRNDPNNALAWLALAYAQDKDLRDPDPALDKAATAPQVHDYGFELTKLAVEATGHTQIPAGAFGYSSPETLRWDLTTGSQMVNMMLGNWLMSDCKTSMGDPDRAKKCDAVKVNIRRGDSRLTMIGDKAASAALDAAFHRPAGMSDSEFDKIMLDTISSSSTEREWATKAGARLHADKPAH